MIGVLLDWSLDLHALVGDISQFYNCFKLQLSHIAYQKILYRENLEPSNKVIEAVITSLIYGVRSVAAQSEAGIQKICELVEDVKKNVVFLLRKRRLNERNR